MTTTFAPPPMPLHRTNSLPLPPANHALPPVFTAPIRRLPSISIERSRPLGHAPSPAIPTSPIVILSDLDARPATRPAPPSAPAQASIIAMGSTSVAAAAPTPATAAPAAPASAQVISTPTAPPPISLVDLFGHQAGCRDGLTNEEYHADRSCISTSGLKEALRSAAHYQSYLRNPREETRALYLGTAIHCLLLEPQRFASEYVVAPEGDRRSKSFKEFAAAHPGQKIITADESDMLVGIAHSVMGHTTACNLLRAGLVEQTIIWQDRETGLWIKIRPDCLCIDVSNGVCLDVKSTEDASEDSFMYACRRYGYDMQAAIYLTGLREVFQRDFDFAFLPVEKKDPYGCAVYGAPQGMLQSGYRRFRKALNTIKRGVDSGEWPCYQPDGGFSVLPWLRNWV